MNNKNKFRAFMGYQTGDFGNTPAVYTDSADFETKKEANAWINKMFNSGCDFDCSMIEEITEENDLFQIEEYEEQEKTRLELGIPKNLY
jgi:hypothetical protein